MKHGSHGTATSYQIMAARPRDLVRLPAIELAAARLLVGHAPESVLAAVTSEAELSLAQKEGRLWVALADDVAVGFAHVRILEPSAVHLEELDVHPEHGRRGLGAMLVTTVCDWAAANEYEKVTLRTFRDVRWNMPFYASLGFTVVPSTAITPALASIVLDESTRGLDLDRRVLMHWLTRVSR